jgi:hypothetical protein
LTNIIVDVYGAKRKTIIFSIVFVRMVFKKYGASIMDMMVRMSAKLVGASWALTLLQCSIRCQVYAPCTFLGLLLNLSLFSLHHMFLNFSFFMHVHEFICNQE